MSQDYSSWEYSEGDEIVPGRYALRRIGGGSAYEAYLAWDQHLGHLVVAKIIRPDHVEDAGHLKALAREADLLNGLSHPIIVRCFDAVLEGPVPHLVLEHLEGNTLRHLIRFGPVPMEQLLPLALSMCSGIHYLSNMDVVHLDIKSRNTVMGVPPRIIDFSVARTKTDAKKITGLIGTDPYMAPEQCAPGERGEIGTPADVWGMGVALYRAANATLPFPRDKDYDRSDPIQRFPQLKRPPAIFKEKVPPLLEETILRCLEPDPSDRPEAMDVAETLEPLIAALPRKPVLRRARPGKR